MLILPFIDCGPDAEHTIAAVLSYRQKRASASFVLSPGRKVAVRNPGDMHNFFIFYLNFCSKHGFASNLNGLLQYTNIKQRKSIIKVTVTVIGWT